jgi:hypothetical protein
MFQRLVVRVVELVSLNRIRGQHYFKPFKPSLRWWYVSGLKRFGHGGWIFLHPTWLVRFKGGN